MTKRLKQWRQSTPRLGIAIVAWCGAAAAVAAAGRPPNVLLIVSDDQGWGDLGCYGNPRVQTPNLDRLAAGGVRLTNFYVAWPACTPSRASLLTGRYPQRHGLYDMIRNEAPDYGKKYTPAEYAVTFERIAGLDEREALVSDLLSDAGYRCGMVGKWDLGMQRRFLPLSRGFHDFYGFVNTGIDYFTHERYGVPSMYRGFEPDATDRGEYATWLFEREAARFIRENAEKPFFLYLAFNAPHAASSLDPEVRGAAQAPRELQQLYQSDGAGASITRGQLNHQAAINGMDQSIGRLLDLLTELDIDERTAVIFLSDNGASSKGSNGALRGHKGQVWEGGVRVPCIVRVPQVSPAGVECNALLTALEAAPTILALAGVQPPDGLTFDGVDMTPVLAGRRQQVRDRMFWQRRDQQAARVDRWKWVNVAGEETLFDLEADPGERRDLSGDRPEKVAELRAAFDRWQTEMDAAPPRGPFRDY
jgi:arylsulfatase A